MIEIPSFAIFLFGALGALFLRNRILAVWCIAVPTVSAMLLVFGGAADTQINVSISGLTLVLHKVDKLSLVFGYVFHIAAILGGIFSWRSRNPIHQAAALGYAGSCCWCGFLR